MATCLGPSNSPRAPSNLIQGLALKSKVFKITSAGIHYRKWSVQHSNRDKIDFCVGRGVRPNAFSRCARKRARDVSSWPLTSFRGAAKVWSLSDQQRTNYPV